MIAYLLDTDIVSLLQDGNKAVISKIVSFPPEHIATSIITVEEQLSAWYTLLRKARRPEQLVPIYQRMTATVRFLSLLPLLTFTTQAADLYVALRKLHPRAGRMDLRIAAIARAHDAILVTRNIADFENIEGLHVEDWSKG